MLLDPFTIIAQIVNFAILVVALKYFLYDRVITAMDEREASIAARLSDAEQREADAAREAEALRERQREVEQQHEALLDEARADADRHRKQLLEEVRADVDSQRHRWQRALWSEQHEVQDELRSRTAERVVEVSRQALADLAGADLEGAVVDQALTRLEADADARDRLTEEQRDGSPLIVRTAFAISAPKQEQIIERLRVLGLAAQRPVRFEQDHSVVLGLELLVDGTAISWHADDYLARLESRVDGLVDAPDQDDDGR